LAGFAKEGGATGATGWTVGAGLAAAAAMAPAMLFIAALSKGDFWLGSSWVLLLVEAGAV